MTTPVRARSRSVGSIEDKMNELHLDLAPMQPLDTYRPRSRSCGNIVTGQLSPPSGSQTARNGLIQALKSVDAKNQLRKLEFANGLSTLELAIYLAALLQMPYVADEKELISACIIELAGRFTTMESCPIARWEKLSGLLLNSPKLGDLADFIQEPDGDKVPVQDDFVYSTWSRLSLGLNSPTPLYELELLDVLMEEVVPDWLTMQKYSSTTNAALLLTWYMIGPERPSDWSIEHLAQKSSYQTFVIEALTMVVDTDMAYTLLTKFANLLPEKAWSLVPLFSENCLNNMGFILQKNTSTNFDPIICLRVLENPCETLELKHAILCVVINSLDLLDVVFLYKLLDTLINAKVPENSRSYFVDIVMRTINKKWFSSHIAITYEIDGLFDGYRQTADLFIKNLYEILLTKYDCDEIMSRSSLDRILSKYITTLLENLEQFAEENLRALDKISPRIKETRRVTSIAIKSASLQLIFHIYGYFYGDESKAAMYAKLASTLGNIRVSKDASEFMVVQEINPSSFIRFCPSKGKEVYTLLPPKQPKG